MARTPKLQQILNNLEYELDKEMERWYKLGFEAGENHAKSVLITELSTAMPVNALRVESSLTSKVHRYQFVSGDAVEIQAESKEQAEKIYQAWHEGNSCPCGSEECDCVEETETLTIAEEL
jgi:hypothetical protein